MGMPLSTMGLLETGITHQLNQIINITQADFVGEVQIAKCS